MAAPATKTIKDLNGSWLINNQLSDPADPILKLQGINWLMRKVITMATLTLVVDQSVHSDTGHTHLNIESKPSNGMPGAQERRILNWTPVELNHTLLGSIRGRSRFCKPADVGDEWLAQGWEEEEGGSGEVIHFYTEHLDSKPTVTQQVCGFVRVDGVRRHARKVLVTKAVGERVEGRLVYDFVEGGR